MQIQAISFKGMINIVGKDTNLLVNHDSIESISNEKYLDTKSEDGSLIDWKIKQGTYLNLASGTKIKVFAPLENVLEAYKQSKGSDVELKTKHNPLQIDKTILNSL